MAARPETHMSSSSSSSSSSDSESYDVFLSFRGEDTRGNFTDHLYRALNRAGIRTFRDNEELHKGKEIGQGLMKAIIESKISIPVFSENYASSKWCLKELAQIMKCMENDGQIVLPVFYKVNPSDIRHQTGSFAEAFLEHEKTQPKGCVDSWRKALEQAGSLKGWHYEKREHSEADTIDSIVEEVLNELKKTTALHVGDHLIGIDSRVDDVITLLDLESQDVQYMAICGMGGLGKTTIAKAVFNKICCCFRGDSKGLSFLEDVSSTSKQVDGLVKLQNKLVSGILGNNQCLDNRSQGINIIKERCRNKKVLIILDDVDHDDQLHALAGHPNWFGSGSRIIITTREKNILQVKQVETKIYEPEVLNENQSLQLFSNHAFGKDQPPKTFMLLSRKVVEIVGGLPLAIEVLGSFLNGVSCHDVWESTVDNLKKIPNDDIQKKLQISYDRLNAFEKDIFLDIACFFIGMDKEIVIHILEEFSPEKNIYVLIRKSLVSIDDNNMLRMHDLLRDMGREIVRQESPKNVGERTRLWSRGDALDVLKKGKGTSRIEGLSLVFRHDVSRHYYDPLNDRCLKIEEFKPMSDLRLLQVDGAYFDGNFDALSTELKWLSWKRIPSKCIPSISHLRKLSVLDLSESMITEDWNGWQHIQKVKTLKVLDLGGCRRLTRTPDFSYNTMLQRLILDGCWSLVACEESIGCLKKLVYLTLKYCVRIKKLPDSICKLSSLTALILSNCRKLEKLPKALGDMKYLTELMIDGTGIEELPDSIGSLEKLGRLSAKDCFKLARLPRSMGKLRRLQYINLLGTCIIELPEGFGNLWSLKELKMSYCKAFILPFPLRIRTLEGRREFQSIPHLPLIIFELNAMLCVSRESLRNLSNFKSLECLHVYHCERLTEIEDLNGLTLLQQLVLKNCPMLRSLPELPPSLTRLDIGGCKSMKSLPNLSDFNKLEELYLVNCKKITKIEGLTSLSLLQQLDLTNCKMLQTLPELPSSLIKLNIGGCDSMVSMPNLSNLNKLEVLRANDCGKLAKIEGMGGLSLLQELDLRNCLMLQTLPELPPTLTRLDIEGCESMESLPNLSNLKILKQLCLNYCGKLAKIEGMGGLSLLQELDLQNCVMLQSLPELPPTLTGLDIEGCESMESLPNLSNLKILKHLWLNKCGKLAKIEGMGGLSLLQVLDLQNCVMLQSLPELPPTLTRLDIEGCESMESLPNLSNLKILEELCLNNCGKLAKIEGMGGLSMLQVLDLRNCVMLQSLPELPPTLTKLDIEGCESIESLPNLSNLKILEELCLNNCGKLAKIEGMSGLSLLQELDLQNCVMLQSLPELPPTLTGLDIEGCESMESLPNLSNLKILKHLWLNKCGKLAKIEGMGGVSLLQVLDLRNCVMLQSLPELPPALTSLDIEGCASMESLTNLSNLKILKQLCLNNCGKLAKIEGMGGLSLLQKLDLRNCLMLQSLPKLPPTLTGLDIEGCESMESLPNLSNLKILEELCLKKCGKLAKIEGMGGLSLLQVLVLQNCVMLQSLPALPPNLTILNIEGCESMESLPNLSNLKILKQLCLNNCGKLTKIEGMGGLSLLKELNLRNCVMLQSLPELPPNLISIDLSYCMSMERLANLSSLKILKRLYLDNCEKLIKIEGMNSLSLPPQLVLQNCIVLQSLPELPSILTKLQVRGCMKLSEIEGIIGLSLLKVLDLYDCRELRTLPDLSNLKKLEELLLERCDNLVEIRGLESLESLKYFRVLRCNTYIKTLQKCVAQGMLVGPFHRRNINEIYQIPDNDENIKGMALLLVYQTPLQLLGKPIHLEVEAEIMRNDGESILCCHDLQIEGKTGTDVDGYYSCYFHGLTWFGLPLRKQYIIQVTRLSYWPEEPHQVIDEFRTYEVRMKMFVIIPEYETREDSQKLKKRIAPLITCTSVESEGVGRDKKPDDDTDPSTWFTLGGGEGQGPISCSQQREGKWEHDDEEEEEEVEEDEDDDGDDDEDDDDDDDDDDEDDNDDDDDDDAGLRNLFELWYN